MLLWVATGGHPIRWHLHTSRPPPSRSDSRARLPASPTDLARVRARLTGAGTGMSEGVLATIEDDSVSREPKTGPEAVEASRAASEHQPSTVAPEAAAPAEPEAPIGFLVDLPAFAGPLDLLLSLIRDEKVDIYDIPIARIAKQFLLRIRVLQLNDAAEYLELAARLLRIKAQMLLPRHGEAETWKIPARSSCVGCSSISRCARWSTSSSDAATSVGAGSPARTCRSREKWRRHRWRYRSVSC